MRKKDKQSNRESKQLITKRITNFLIGIIVLVIFSNLSYAASITTNVTETNINSMIQIAGTGFSADTVYYIIPLLENKSAWWDSYAENWFFNDTSTNNTINVTTNSSGEFTYNMYIPNDWRVSGGKVTFKIGESLSSALLWSAQGTNWAATQPTKNGVTGDTDPNGFIYTASNVGVVNQGGIEKFYKSNGTKACNYTYGTASNINDISTNGSIAYGVTSGGNILRINTTNCALIGTTATAAVVAYSVNVAPDNTYMIITYAASTAPRKYNITVDPPTLIAAYAPTAVASIAYDSCISPSSNVTYIAYANGNVTALYSNNGSVIWNSDPPETELGNAGYAFPVYGVACDDTGVYLARGQINYPAGIIEQGFVEALWASNGSRAWINTKTDTAYDGMDVNNIKCDTSYCYAVKATTPAIYSGVMGSAIVQINKTDGNVTWQNWRSWLPTTYNGPYGTGGTHSSAQSLWIDSNTTGYLYPVYTNGWVQKIAKTDLNASNYDSNLWIRGSTNFWNYVADVPKNIWLSNETPYYTFRHWNQQGVPLNTNNGSINGTFFRFSMLNTFNSFTAYEYSVTNVLGNALFIDPVIQTATTQRAEVQYFNGTYHAACPNTRYAPGLTGWKYQDRACHYNEIPATLSGFNIGTTINGTFITGIFYSLIKTKFWDNYSITKYYGNDNWAWAEWHNTTNNQVLGFTTKFGSDQEDVYSDNYGRAVLFYNNAAGNAYYRPQFRADLNRKSDTYILFLPKTPDPNNTIGENTMWRRVDIETQKIANPVNITLSQEDSGSFSISGNTYERRINFTAQEPNLFNRSDEPVEIIFNATGGIRSDCQDVIITDTSDTPILLWQVDNFTACSQNNNVSVWIMMNWTQNESKSLRLYYNSSGATPTPSGTTDLIVTTAAGACGTNNHEVNINSSNWYYWARPAAATAANEITRFNFNDTTTNMWTSGTHYQVANCYKNSNATGTGAGAAADTCGTAAAPISRCLAVGSTGKIFAKLNATVAMGAIANRNVTVDTLYVEYYFFANTGRVRIRTQLNKTLPILNTTVSKNWPPYYYFSINALVPPSGANAWTYYSGLYEQMKRPVATFNSDYTEANLSSGPLPLMFYINYDGINNIPQTNGSILRPSTPTDNYWDKGCTAHKEWQYYVYTGGATYGTATAPLYTSEFISCSKNVSDSLPQMGEPGYVNVIPEMAWDNTNVNRWYDPSLIGKFYMQPNLYRPYNRENRFLAPYAITNPYSTSARISSYIIPVCPEKEYGYKGYDDFLTDLPNLLADTSIHIRNNTNNIPCAAQIIRFTDQRGSDGTQIIFAKNLSVIVGETMSAGWTYPFNTHASGTYTLQPDGELDMTFAQKAVTTTGYYGKYYFTYTSNNYVIHTFSTSGNPQTFTVPTTGASHNVRYSFAPEAFYTKKVYDESTLWDKESQNFTYYRNPCWLGRYNNIYGSTETGHPALATLSTPGWQKPMFAAGYTCAHNTYNMEIQDVFRPAWSSIYPTAAAAGVMTENMVDGRMNLAGTGSPPGATDTYAVARHNSLYDYKHNDDFNNIFDDTNNLNQNEKHPNKQPWTCQISRHTNRSFCVLTMSLSGLIYNSNPGAGLAAAQPWSPYWTSTAELSTFRHYYMPRFFDTSGWQWTYDHLLEVNIYPTLDQDELLTSNLLYVSDNPDDYNTFFNKQSSQATLGLQQTQFLLKDWKNAVFFVFNRDSRIYSPGTEMNITGVAIRNGEYFANKNFSVGIYLNNGSVVLINNSVISNEDGSFNVSFNITNNFSSGLHYVLLNYNNSEFSDSIPVMITNLVATVTHDKAVYEQGQTVYTNITITNSLTGALTDPVQLELRYINPSSTVIECAKYPSAAIVPSCDYNLTKTGIGTYSYNISLGSNPLGTYTARATVTNEGVTADYTKRFVVALIDPCQPNTVYNYALSYPMQYNNISDTLTIIGNSTFGNSTNPITTEDMYKFAQATKGTCIIDRPTNGTYTIKSGLIIGNGTQTVYVRSKGESISFSSEIMPQLLVNSYGHITFGNTIDNIPQEGCSVKFSSKNSNNILINVSGGEIAFYDSYVTDSGSSWGRFIYGGTCGNSTQGTYSAVNSTIEIKKTTFDRATRGQFFYTGNVTIDDMKINRINSTATDGYGIIAGCALSSLNNLQIYHQEQNGSAIQVSEDLPANTSILITNSFFGYNTKDLIASKDGRGIQLINTEWDRTYGFNWTGIWSGTTSIKESYSYLPQFLDGSSQGIENITIILLDRLGNIQLVEKTNSSGEIPEQYISTWQVDKTLSGETIGSFNPYTSYAKKYGIQILSEPKLFSSKKVEIKQMVVNPFITLPELQAGALANITYNTPTKVEFGTEYNDSWSLSGQLKNYPVDQCQYFALFANDTLLSKGVNYNINYETGAITFLQDYSGYTIYPVYFYGGNITITNGFTLMNAISMNDIYDYTQYQTSKNNLTEDVYTVDGTTYIFCVNLVVGNATNKGSLSDPDATLTFKDGYDMTFDGQGGFVDLAGITSGGGSSGGLPLNIFDSVGSMYAPGNVVELFSTVINSNGILVDANVNIYIYEPNGTLYTTASMTEISTGRLKYNFTLPSDAALGTWRIDIDATYLDSEVHDNVAFGVSSSTGGGSGGGTTPTIQIDGPSSINTNTNFGIIAFAKNNNSQLVNCDSGATLTVTDSINGSVILNAVSMTNSGTGQYNYTTSLSYQSTFLARVSCSISGTSYISNPKIISSQNVASIGGSSYPTIQVEASTPIATTANASIGALVKSSSGTITNCDASLGISIRDISTGVTTNGTMTNFGTGMYNYTWQTPVTPSVFYVNVSCSVSGTSYTGFSILSTQSTGAQATVDYNQIALYVWNYTSRNLTYYNQSAAESIQSCLRDATCSGWWLNTTLTNIQNTINSINNTVNQINISAQTILSYQNCSSNNDVCTKLTNIINNATDIQARVLSLNVTQIPALQTSIGNIYTDTQFIRNNMANATALLTYTQDLNNSLWWLRNNTLNQTAFNANMTNIFSRLTEINTTTNNIQNNINCSNPANSILCTYLNNINTTTNNIQTNMVTYAQVQNISNDTQWIKNNMINQTTFNANITSIISGLYTINTTTQNIQNNINCSNPANSILCTYLNNINTTTNNIQTNMATASQVNNVLGNTSWLINNVATSTEIQNNFTQTLNRLSEINTTVQQVYSSVLSENQTLSQELLALGTNISWIRDNVATSTEIQNNFTQTVGLLGNINTTLVNTQSYLYGQITNRLSEMNNTLDNTQSYLYNNITLQLISLNDTMNQTYSVVNNMSLQQNNTIVLDELSKIQQNLTFIKNNMFYQGNATGNFFVDYASTPYIETNNKAELWMSTLDLLGNPKTVISANCNITRNGTFVATASTSISPGSVYAYWNVPLGQSSGEHSWNCVLNGSIMNIYVPFFVASQKTDFSISALVSGSPRYPNENVLVEAMFSGLNGSDIIPDTINLTIYDSNNNAWANASKSDFTRGSDNIWRYSKSIEANPTTGMYTIHLYATYQGIAESKSTQFRIATGGPYKVYLDCPSSTSVGSDLGCTVIIQDEGEAATETITTVWVDINNNGVNDSGEPRMSFSKRTVPFQTVTQPITLNIPISHPLGLFMIQADTEYLNSVQPHSKASDTVLFSLTSPSTETGGGTGGGGGGASNIISQNQSNVTNIVTETSSGSKNASQSMNISNANVYLSGDIVCNKPYIRKGVECCLDLNNNAVCDYDERIPGQYPIYENEGLRKYFDIPQTYLIIIIAGLFLLLLLILIIFLLIPNYVKRMRKALAVDKERREEEIEKDRYTTGYRDAYHTYTGSNAQIFGSIISDKNRDKQEIQVSEETITPTETVDKNIKEEQEIKLKIAEIEKRLNEEKKDKIADQKIEEHVEKETKIEEIKPPKNNPEPVLNIKKEPRTTKEVYGDKRFFLTDGIHISNLNQLVSMLENMDVEMFNRHVNEHKNDFYNWIFHALDEKVLALKIRNVRNKKEMTDIIREYILLG